MAEFDEELYKNYLENAKKEFPDIDTHFLEFAIAEYMYKNIYNITEKHPNAEEDFKRANQQMEILIQQSKEIV
jgi:hypothetical protein